MVTQGMAPAGPASAFSLACLIFSLRSAALLMICEVYVNKSDSEVCHKHVLRLPHLLLALCGLAHDLCGVVVESDSRINVAFTLVGERCRQVYA